MKRSFFFFLSLMFWRSKENASDCLFDKVVKTRLKKVNEVSLPYLSLP